MGVPENRHGQAVDLRVAEQALENGNPVFAGEVCNRILQGNPEDVEALIVLAKALIDGGKSAIAMLAAEKAAKLAEDDWRTWLLVGACESSLERVASIEPLQKALSLCPGNASILRTLAFACIIGYRFEEARKYAAESLALDPHHPQGHVALSYALLHARDWGNGWDEYAYGMGHQRFREVQDYGIPEWNGKRAPLLVYAEQGLGDQLAYCSAVNESETTQLVCDPKLVHLLNRSVKAECHGDQFNKQIDWPIEAKYQVSMSGLMRAYRRTSESFPRTPYLKPHPEKALQWRALLDSLGPKKKVGIAWTGGNVGTAGWQTRNLTLEQMAPILELDADFICLEYKDRSDELVGYPIHDWSWATRTADYDDTAALVANLDAVVCVPTTIYHLAGGLGIKTFVSVHETPHWHEGLTGPCPWWGSVELYRRAELGADGSIRAIARDLKNYLEAQS